MEFGKPGSPSEPQQRPQPTVPPSLQDLVNPVSNVRSTSDQFPHTNVVPPLPPLLVSSQEGAQTSNMLMNAPEIPPLHTTPISHILNPAPAVTRSPPKQEQESLTLVSFFARQCDTEIVTALAEKTWLVDDESESEPPDLTYTPPEREDSEGQKRDLWEELVDLVIDVFETNSTEPKPQRKIKRTANYVPVPRYDEWQKVGHGYLVIPDLPRLNDVATYTDFLFQGFLKVLATGGEGNSSGFIRDEQAPLLAASARLEYSMNIDEHGIETLKVEAKMAKNLTDQGAKNSVDYLAKLRNTLAHRLREYSDDRASIYRPPVDIMEDTPEKAQFYSFKASEFYFLTYMIRMIELSSRLMPKHTMVISKALHNFVPLILAAKKLPSLDVHFVGGRLYLNYFHHLFRMLSRLSEYFNDLRTLPLLATFGALSTVRADVTCVHSKELVRISDDIDYGGCLSWGLCVLRDLSIAVSLNPRAVAMVSDVVQLLTTKGESLQPAALFQCAYAVKERGRLYKFRFLLDEKQCLTFRATKATKDEMRQAASIVTSIPCPVSPFYQLLANTPDATADSPDTACVPELSDFIVDVQPIVLSHYHNGLPTMGLQFQPRSRATLISYDAP